MLYTSILSTLVSVQVQNATIESIHPGKRDMDARMLGGEHKVRPYDFIVFVVGANLVFALMSKSRGSAALYYYPTTSCSSWIVSLGDWQKRIYQIAQDFRSDSRRNNRRIVHYVTVIATQKLDDKDKQVGMFFDRNHLNWLRLSAFIILMKCEVRKIIQKRGKHDIQMVSYLMGDLLGNTTQRLFHT
ncbi:MAG: hypothetical protein BECKG1743E_GA0114224_100274 [Candidatus Kentron sp. G]|nr:MAG: hypothetical protein BECKG1743E_GA0114224_100274 [Candidatus Kentron sp. G]